MKPIKVPIKPYLMSMFPNASQTFLDENQTNLSRGRRFTQSGKQNDSTGILKATRGILNKTEVEFALMLEAQKRAGEILRYEFEGITLRWADMRYTPDFVVFVPISEFIDETVYGDDPVVSERTRLEIKLIEVKGGHIWDRDTVRFKGARAYWPEFAFEMHQKTKQGWKRKF